MIKLIYTCVVVSSPDCNRFNKVAILVNLIIIEL